MQNRWLLAIAIVLSGLVFTEAASAEEPVRSPKEFLVPVMSVSTVKNLTEVDASKIIAGAIAAGANGFQIKYPTIPLTAHTRGAKDLMRLAEGWRIPMATMIAPTGFVRAIAGDALAAVVQRGEIALGINSATVRDAQVGDMLTLRDIHFNKVVFRIGAIVAEPFVNYGDMLMSAETAAKMGTMSIARVSIINFDSPKKVLASLLSRGISIGDHYRLRTTWDLQNPDGTIGLGEVKALVGEYAYKPTVGSSILIDRSWTARTMSWGNRYKDIALRNNCSTVVAKAIQGALSEIKNKGLAHAIDVRGSNRSGGCFVGRYNRLSRSFAAPSRHAWGMAFDINTAQNPQGGIPVMNCKIVRIFRKWGFAWGGNFWPADGMHFEYVGEPRDTLGYPSKYCRNVVDVPSTTVPSESSRTTSTSTSTTTSTTTPLVVETSTTVTLIP